MKHLIPVLFLLLPAVLFAQSPKEQESAMLKKLGLNDSQITQVLDIQDKTQATIRQDRAELRLLHAQMEKALLPASPNMQEVNGYVTRMGQTHTDLMKVSVGAQVQLRQILGDDNLPVYSRFIKHRYDLERPRGMSDTHSQMQGGMMSGSGSMMGGSGSMMGGPIDEGE